MAAANDAAVSAAAAELLTAISDRAAAACRIKLFAALASEKKVAILHLEIEIGAEW